MRWLAILALVGCAYTVRQDAHTGRDGKLSGATELRVDDRVTATGIVTYPGGDRVDWYAIRVARPGEVAVELTWRSPRPGLRLDFEMFDDVRARIEHRYTRAKSRIHRDAGRVNDVVYVRVYARGRGDAGRYRLTVTRTDPPPPNLPYTTSLDFPDPPDLPKVPEPTMCDPYSFDPHRICEPPRCSTDAPPGWPGCPPARCPTPPDINIPVCWTTMPCPNPPDPRVLKCPRPPPPTAPLVVRVISVQVDGGDQLLVAAGGSDQGITKAWHAAIARDENGTAFAGGDATIVIVNRATTLVKAHLTFDQIPARLWVKLVAP